MRRQMDLQEGKWADYRKNVTWIMSNPVEADLDLSGWALVTY